MTHATDASFKGVVTLFRSHIIVYLRGYPFFLQEFIWQVLYPLASWEHTTLVARGPFWLHPRHVLHFIQNVDVKDKVLLFYYLDVI